MRPTFKRLLLSPGVLTLTVLLITLLPSQGYPGVFDVGPIVGAQTFSEIFFEKAQATSFRVTNLATPNNEAGIRNYVTYAPDATSTGTVISIYGKTTYSGSINMANPGHIIGTMGHVVTNASTKTLDLAIGQEGKVENTAGTLTSGVGSLGVLTANASGQTITTWIGNLSQLSTNAGTITSAVGFQSKLVANAGTIGTYAAFHVPSETLSGITTRYAFLNDDVDSVVQNASAFVSPGTATCADDGAGTAASLSLLPITHVIALTNSDANGCNVTLSETGMPAGKLQTTIVVVANAGGTVNFVESAGVQEVGTTVNLAITDSITFVYTNSAWYRTATADN